MPLFREAGVGDKEHRHCFLSFWKICFYSYVWKCPWRPGEGFRSPGAGLRAVSHQTWDLGTKLLSSARAARAPLLTRRMFSLQEQVFLTQKNNLHNRWRTPGPHDCWILTVYLIERDAETRPYGLVVMGLTVHRWHVLVRKVFKLPSPHFCLLVYKRYIDPMKPVSHLHNKTYPKAKMR